MTSTSSKPRVARMLWTQARAWASRLRGATTTEMRREGTVGCAWPPPGPGSATGMRTPGGLVPPGRSASGWRPAHDLADGDYTRRPVGQQRGDVGTSGAHHTKLQGIAAQERPSARRAAERTLSAFS